MPRYVIEPLVSGGFDIGAGADRAARGASTGFLDRGGGKELSDEE